MSFVLETHINNAQKTYIYIKKKNIIYEKIYQRRKRNNIENNINEKET